MSDVRPLEVHSTRLFKEDNGILRVLDSFELPFDVVRFFFIDAPAGATRGQHAHAEGQQFFIVVSGFIEVRIEDPKRVHHLFGLRAGECLLVPPLHWASEHFEGEGSILLVLCDLPYSEDDYIRNYSVFEGRLTASQ